MFRLNSAEEAGKTAGKWGEGTPRSTSHHSNSFPFQGEETLLGEQGHFSVSEHKEEIKPFHRQERLCLPWGVEGADRSHQGPAAGG